jgi:asparagine synthase (glutamine-hydrolysing)
VPVGEWFRKESFPWLQSTLQDSGLLQRLFRRDAIDGLLTRHRDGTANHTRELRALAALALWWNGIQAGT